MELQVSTRKIRLERQQGEQIPFVAIDEATGDVLFRHHDLDELEALCRKLRWDILSNRAPYSHITFPPSTSG
jgi:hypothetical protein